MLWFPSILRWHLNGWNGQETVWNGQNVTPRQIKKYKYSSVSETEGYFVQNFLSFSHLVV